MEDPQNSFEHYCFKVDDGQKPLRIDKYLSNRIANISRNKIKEASQNNCIIVNTFPVKVNYKIKPGDCIKIMLSYPPNETKLVAENIPLNIVYEDNILLVVNKAAGMVVHPSYGHYNGTLINALAYYLKGLSLFNSNDPRPGLVHRIDKNTSGLLVIAKSETAKQHLAQQFLNKTAKRTYIAFVWGNLKDEEGTIIGNIGRNKKNRKIMDVFLENETGKHAITHYKVLERFGYVNLIECTLETGRTHQIRVHFKHIKHPIFNDAEYGGDIILRGTVFTKYKQFVNKCFAICPRQALHAKSLGFVHPKTNKFVMFEADIPDDMELLINKWRNYIKNREIFT